MKTPELKLSFYKVDGQLQPSNRETRAWVDALDDNQHVKLQISAPRRSLDQNALIHALYNAVQQQCDWSTDEVTQYAKLHHGVPILRRDDQGFSERWAELTRHLDYEQKLKLMDWLPVTRLMTKAQATEYIDAIIMDFTKQGYAIVMPGDQYAA